MTDETPHNPYQAPDSTIQSQAKPDTPELASRLYRLLGALIDGDADFRAANFIGELDFGADCRAAARFQDARFKARTDFRGAHFHGETSFKGAVFGE